MTDDLLAYYRRRAQEYERIYDKPERQEDLALLKELVSAEMAARDVLEIACGTGYWTQLCAPKAASILATDLAEETLEIARTKTYPPDRVRFAIADAYRLEAVPGRFDAGLATFWWSHVPRERVKEFLEGWHRRLGPGARVLLLDNRYVEGSSTPITREDSCGNTFQTRALQDGSHHEVLKNFPTEDELLSLLGPSASGIRWQELPYYWCLTYTVGP